MKFGGHLSSRGIKNLNFLEKSLHFSMQIGTSRIIEKNFKKKTKFNIRSGVISKGRNFQKFK